MSEEALEELAWLQRMKQMGYKVTGSEIREMSAYDTLAENSTGRTKEAYEDLAWLKRIEYLTPKLLKPTEEELRKEKARDFWRKKGKIPPIWSQEYAEGTY